MSSDPIHISPVIVMVITNCSGIVSLIFLAGGRTARVEVVGDIINKRLVR